MDNIHAVLPTASTSTSAQDGSSSSSSSSSGSGRKQRLQDSIGSTSNSASGTAPKIAPSTSSPSQTKPASSQPQPRSLHQPQHQHLQPVIPYSHSAEPSPLPIITPLPAQITSLRTSLKRRRSSYPPDNGLNQPSLPPSSAISSLSSFSFPFNSGGTPNPPSSAAFAQAHTQAEGAGARLEYGGQGDMSSGWTAGLNGLFDLGGSGDTSASGPAVNPVQQAGNDTFSLFENMFTPGLPIPGLSKHTDLHLPAHSLSSSPSHALLNSHTNSAASSSKHTLNDLSNTLSPSRIAQNATDLAWKTILASVVDVEGVGEVGVARVLHEIWKRGGGDVVTNQCLWPSIIMSLSLSPSSTIHHGHNDMRIPTPSAHASLSLQQLYNLTMRQWEPSIFSGLLAQYASTPAAVAPTHNSTSSVHAFSGNHAGAGTGALTPLYGPSTPTKELDLTQWMNMTPGADWSTFLSVTAGTSTPEKAAATTAGPGPSSLANVFDPREDMVGDQRRGSILPEVDDPRGIDELLAQMEEEESRRQAAQHSTPVPAPATADQAPASSTLTPAQTPVMANTSLKGKQAESNANTATFFLPTPETDGAETPSLPDARNHSITSSTSTTTTVSNTITHPQPHAVNRSRKSFDHQSPPDEAASPFVTANSAHSYASSSTSSTVSRTIPSTRAPHPTMLPMPTATFIPPPPMCMFFNPSFKDLTVGKLGVWKGDLEVKGRGGGRFAVLVVGETGTDYLWQSHLWPSTISYPPEGQPAPETCTSSMIPVSHLARDGFTPVSMGMVLCNDADVGPFCAMVQGLHAEGVAFHLPTPSRLPIVLLPAKFDSSDNLQRLGIAYMSKPGVLPPPPPPPGPMMAAKGADLQMKKGVSVNNVSGSGSGPGDEKKRKRRQSAPAKAAAGFAAASRAVADSPAADTGGGGRKKRVSMGLGRVEEGEE